MDRQTEQMLKGQAEGFLSKSRSFDTIQIDSLAPFLSALNSSSSDPFPCRLYKRLRKNRKLLLSKICNRSKNIKLGCKKIDRFVLVNDTESACSSSTLRKSKQCDL